MIVPKITVVQSMDIVELTLSFATTCSPANLTTIVMVRNAVLALVIVALDLNTVMMSLPSPLLRQQQPLLNQFVTPILIVMRLLVSAVPFSAIVAQEKSFAGNQQNQLPKLPQLSLSL